VNCRSLILARLALCTSEDMFLKRQPALEKDPAPIAVKMKVNGADVDLIIDARSTLLTVEFVT
jgi:hypothetical protein